MSPVLDLYSKLAEDKPTRDALCAKPHQGELALSGKEALSNPLTELSLISHNTHTHYRRKQIQRYTREGTNMGKENCQFNFDLDP